MRVCETLIESGIETTKCFDIQMMPTFSDEARDALILITASAFFAVFAIKIAQRLLLGV